MSEGNVASSGLDLTIEDVGYRGRGVGRDSGKVVFVPGVIVGERVRVRITHRHKRFADAELLEVLEPSPMRVAPTCPLALRPSHEDGARPYPCVGCAYQQMAYEEEVRMKQRQLVSLLKRIAKLETLPLTGPVSSPRAMGYRNKIRLHGGTYKGERVLGYVGANNHSVLDVPCCPLAREPINVRLAELRNQPGWLQSLRRSAVVTLRYTEADGVLESVRGVQRMKGELTEPSVLGELTVPAGGFFQVNTAVANLLVGHLREVIRESACGHVLDLYCGVGVFGLAAALEGRAVWGVDSDERAIACARKNAKRLLDAGCTEGKTSEHASQRVSFEEAKVERVVNEILGRSSVEDKLAVLDPPRFGLEPSVTAALAAHGPRELVYVSCAPDKLARDLAALVEAGYTLQDVKLFDMFPRTACFETVAVLQRA